VSLGGNAGTSGWLSRHGFQEHQAVALRRARSRRIQLGERSGTTRNGRFIEIDEQKQYQKPGLLALAVQRRDRPRGGRNERMSR
jgi:hypothetical protein